MENQTYHESTDIGNVKGRSHIQIQLFLIGHWCWKFEDLQVFQVFTSEAICDCESKDPPRRFSRDDCDGWRICLACLRHTSHQHYPECGPGVFIHGYEGMIYTNEHTTNNESMSNGFFWSRIFFLFLLCFFVSFKYGITLGIRKEIFVLCFFKVQQTITSPPDDQPVQTAPLLFWNSFIQCSATWQKLRKNIPSSRVVASVTSYAGKESVTKIGPKQGDHKDCERYVS